jgi:hypothetical protein
MFERYDQKLSFLHFWAVSWAIVHSFGFSGWFSRPWHLVLVWYAWQKTRHFCVYGHFCELLPTILGLWGDLHSPWHLVHVWEAWPKTYCFYIFGPFSWAIVHSFGFSGWFSRPWHLVLVWYAWPKTRRFCVYGHTWPMTLSTCLRGMTKNLPFLHFSFVFMSYCPLFWVSEVIYKAHDTH